MTRDEIAKMANDTAGKNWGTEEHFQRFAELVAAAEREAIYQIAAENCNDEPVNAIITAFMSGQYTMAEYLCERIKARGQG